MFQIINLALLREFPGRNSSSVIAKEIVEILGISSDDLDEGSQDDGFRVKVVRLRIHWDLDKGFLGILRRHDFSKSALKAFLTDLDEMGRPSQGIRRISQSVRVRVVACSRVRLEEWTAGVKCAV